MGKKADDGVEYVDLKEKDKKELKKFKAECEAEEALLSLQLKHLEVADAERKERNAARGERFRFYRPSDGHFELVGAVYGDSVIQLSHELGLFLKGHQDTPKKQRPPITLVLNSPGGSVFAGWHLFDELRAASERGHKVTTIVRGMAASMGSVLAQAGDVRVVGPESMSMIHSPSTVAVGNTFDLNDEVEFLKRIEDRMVGIYLKNSKGKIKEAKLRKLFERKELWLDAEQMVKFGLADEVG